MDTINRTEQIHIPFTKNISRLCHISKNLFNEANYIIRQEICKTGRWIRYLELWNSLKHSENYKNLPAQTAQQTLRAVDASWCAFHMAFKTLSKRPENYNNLPSFPRYKKKNGEFFLGFTAQQVKLRKGKFTILKRSLGLVIRTRLPEETKILGARIIPKGVGYVLEILYKKSVKEAPEWLKWSSKPFRALGMDLGVNNLISTANNIGTPPIVFKGGPVKSMNQFYNKRKAELQGEYARQRIQNGKKIKKLSVKRERKINYFFHMISKLIVLYCQMWEIDTIVIGRSKLWKQRINLGKINNQNFVSIPFHRLVNMIRYKAEEVGIRVIEIEESYTSLCSFIDWEIVAKHETYVGKRLNRGLFRSAKGILLNADVNSAYNILRKAIPEIMDKIKENIMVDGIEAVGIHPVRAALN